MNLPAISPSGWVLAALLALTACAPAPAPPDSELALLRGDNAAEQDRHDWARIYYQQYLEGHPDHPETLRKLALAWNAGYQRSLSESADLLERYLGLRPDDAAMRVQMVRVAMLIGQWERARRWADRLDDSPEAELARAEVYVELEPEQAGPVLDRVLAASPDEARGHALAARLADREGDTEAALRHAREAIRLDPFDFQSWYLIGRVERSLGHRDAALAALTRHEKLRRFAEDGSMADVPAAEKLATLEEIEPEVGPHARLLFGRRKIAALLDVGRRSEAASLVQELAADPRATLTDRLLLATQAEEAGRRSLSRRTFERILTEHPDHRGALASVALLRIEAGETAAATKLLEDALARYPHSARLRFLRGRLAATQGEEAAAESAYREALRLASWEHAWRLALADLLRAQGRDDELRELLAAAPEEHPSLAAYRARNPALFGD